MSRPRYDWWGYVKGMIRRYPALKADHEQLHTTTMTMSYTEHIGDSEASRTTENIAIRELPTTEQREYEAVLRAIKATKRYKGGDERLAIIRLIYWDKSHNIDGAAIVTHCSSSSAHRYHTEFLRLVASYYGLLDN